MFSRSEETYRYVSRQKREKRGRGEGGGERGGDRGGG